MNRIKWVYNIGIDGYIEQDRMYQFRIYAPGDFCNPSIDGKWELRHFLGDGVSKSYHRNVDAAKRAALRILDKYYPRDLVWRKDKNFSNSYILKNNTTGEDVMWAGLEPYDRTFTSAYRFGDPVGSGFRTITEAMKHAEGYYRMVAGPVTIGASR